MARELTTDDVAEFRDRLCTVAEGLFAEHGPHQVSIRQIASAMGVSAMTPYRYFKDKEEILAAVRTRGLHHFAEVIERAREGTQGGARSKALAVRNAYLDFAFGNPNCYKLLFDLYQPEEEGYPPLLEAAARARDTMSAYVLDLIAEGVMSGDAEEIGQLFWASTHGAVVLEMAQKLPAGSARDIAVKWESRFLNG